MKIYVASSWRNETQPSVVKALREAGHEVYDFKNPKDGKGGFDWSGIDQAWLFWFSEKFKKSLDGLVQPLPGNYYPFIKPGL